MNSGKEKSMGTMTEVKTARSYVKGRLTDALALTREILPQLRKGDQVLLYGSVVATFTPDDGVVWLHGGEFYQGDAVAFLAYVLRKFW